VQEQLAGPGASAVLILSREFYIQGSVHREFYIQGSVHREFYIHGSVHREFCIHGSVHHESNLIIVFQQDATYSVYSISVGSYTCFRC